MRSILFLFAFSMPLLALTGCFSAEPAITVGSPAAGQVFTYAGDDGSSMVITILGTADRTDGMQERHPAWILEYVWQTAARPDVPIPIHEAIALSDGHHVRHDVLCEVELSTWECYKTDEIFFGPAGLAGGLGTAPLWGQVVEAGPTPAFSGRDLGLFPVEAHWIDVDGQNCLALNSPEPPSLDLRAWMPITSHAGERVVCDGDVLPRRWSPDQPIVASVMGGKVQPRFTLTNITSVAPTADLPDSRPPSPLPRASTGGTTAILSSFEPAEGFDSMTAHRKAIELDADYKDFLDRHQDAMVVRAEYTGDISRTTLTYQDERSWWTLRVAAPSGETYELTVNQVKRDPLTGEETTLYTVRGQSANGDLGEGVPDPASFNGTDADIVFRYGDRLMGQQTDGTWHAYRVPSQHRGVGYPVEDRFYSRAFYTPPDERDQFIQHPWIVETDSMTGRVTYVRLPPEKMMDA